MKTKYQRKYRKCLELIIYEMFGISVITFAKNCVYNTIDKEKMLWLRNEDIKENVDARNLYELSPEGIKGRLESKKPTDEQIRQYKIH